MFYNKFTQRTHPIRLKCSSGRKCSVCWQSTRTMDSMENQRIVHTSDDRTRRLELLRVYSSCVIIIVFFIVPVCMEQPHITPLHSYGVDEAIWPSWADKTGSPPPPCCSQQCFNPQSSLIFFIVGVICSLTVQCSLAIIVVIPASKACSTCIGKASTGESHNAYIHNGTITFPIFQPSLFYDRNHCFCFDRWPIQS